MAPPCHLDLTFNRRVKALDCVVVHPLGPTNLSFCPVGNYLATGGKEGALGIWLTSTSELLYLFHGEVSISSIVWTSPREVLFGRKDGTVCFGQLFEVCHRTLKFGRPEFIFLLKTSSEISVTVFEGLTFPVLHIDYNHGWCALGGGENVQMWGAINCKLFSQKRRVTDGPL